jgi:hypothetical protein
MSDPSCPGRVVFVVAERVCLLAFVISPGMHSGNDAEKLTDYSLPTKRIRGERWLGTKSKNPPKIKLIF